MLLLLLLLTICASRACCTNRPLRSVDALRAHSTSIPFGTLQAAAAAAAVTVRAWCKKRLVVLLVALTGQLWLQAQVFAGV
jgi:hypothetical protein